MINGEAIHHPYAIPGLKFKQTLRTKRDLIDTVIECTCSEFDTNIRALKSSSRFKELVEARHAIMTILMKTGKFTLEEVGRVFGKDHTSVIYAKQRIKDRGQKNPEFELRINRIKKNCGIFLS